MESLGEILKRLQQQSIDARPANAREILASVETEQIVPPCQICGGRVWLRRNVIIGHADFGRAQPCECQLEMSEDQRLSRLRRYSNMGVLSQLNFGDTIPDGRGGTVETKQKFRSAFDIAISYSNEPKGWLVLTGSSGTGKTHLAAAIANRCMERGQPVFFAFVPDLLDHLRASFNPEHELSYDELFEQVKSIPLLILDDLGSQSATTWADEKLFQVLNHRYVAGLPTVITTNTPIDDMDERTKSRLEDSLVAKIFDLGFHASNKILTGIGEIPSSMLQMMNFENFQFDNKTLHQSEKQTLEASFRMAQAYAKDPDGWLVFLGNSGTGKTHLSISIAKSQLDSGKEVFFTFVPDLLDHLRYTFSPDSRVTYDGLFEKVKRTPLLILDDLGAESATPWAHEKLYQIIVQRHNERLPTIITTRNLPSTQGDPIASRLNDPRVVQVMPIEAPDYRNTGSGSARQ